MRIVIAGFALALGLTACTSEADAFCRAGEELNERLENNELDPNDPEGIQALADDFQEVADEAPDEIRADAQRVADGLSALAAGDLSVAEDEEFFPALNRVSEYGEENC